MAIVSEKTKNALLQDFQKDPAQYWNENIPVVDDLGEECEAYLKQSNANINNKINLLKQTYHNTLDTIQKYNDLLTNCQRWMNLN